MSGSVKKPGLPARWLVLLIVLIVAVVGGVFLLRTAHSPTDYDLLPAAGASGEICDSTGLERSFLLDPANGTYVSFYVENTGANNLAVSLDGQQEKILSAGERVRLSAQVTTNASGSLKPYGFKIVSGGDGGALQFRYAITQQDAP